jgi:hypothetical protein
MVVDIHAVWKNSNPVASRESGMRRGVRVRGEKCTLRSPEENYDQ